MTEYKKQLNLSEAADLAELWVKTWQDRLVEEQAELDEAGKTDEDIEVERAERYAIHAFRVLINHARTPPQTADSTKLIDDERNRQVLKEGFSAEHDDQYVNNEMPDAAICYLIEPDQRDCSPFPWPFHDTWWKPSPEDRIRELVKAGALILAEIDRLQRKQNRNEI